LLSFAADFTAISRLRASFFSAVAISFMLLRLAIGIVSEEGKLHLTDLLMESVNLGRHS
jgi:hypothetical protein